MNTQNVPAVETVMIAGDTFSLRKDRRINGSYFIGRINQPGQQSGNDLQAIVDYARNIGVIVRLIEEAVAGDSRASGIWLATNMSRAENYYHEVFYINGVLDADKGEVMKTLIASVDSYLAANGINTQDQLLKRIQDGTADTLSLKAKE